jgi:multidrug efflux pump subunit AcrA (membrane-fusion protein)
VNYESWRATFQSSEQAARAAFAALQAARAQSRQGEEERLTDIYRRKLFECQDELNNLRSEYHNRTAELETEIEDLQRVRRQPAVPEGWRLVPVEPTAAMISAFEHAPCAENYTDAATWAWEAMLDAAPQPPKEDE